MAVKVLKLRQVAGMVTSVLWQVQSFISEWPAAPYADKHSVCLHDSDQLHEHISGYAVRWVPLENHHDNAVSCRNFHSIVTGGVAGSYEQGLRSLKKERTWARHKKNLYAVVQKKWCYLF